MNYYNERPRAMLEPGYICFNGAVLNQAQCNSVNQENREINRFIEAGMPVSDEQLNRAHYAFSMAAGLYE